jgi:hypothetical protein
MRRSLFAIHAGGRAEATSMLADVVTARRAARDRRGRLSHIVAALAITVTVLSAVSARALASPRQLVPAYFGPEGSPSPWQTMCERMQPGSTAIVNPHNGPVKRQAKRYLPLMQYCRERGDSVIGYVYTRYGRRSLRKVERAINDYYLWYPTIQGIFLDEMAEVPSSAIETYYKTLENLIRQKGGFVIGNPGDTATSAWQLGDVDTVVTFEGPAASFASYEPASWVAQAKPEQTANIIFAASGTTQMEAACAKAQAGNAGYVYVTDLPERPDPYEALPSYWTAETERC